MRHAFVLIVPVLLALAGGCAKPGIDLAVASQANVNPDHTGRPSPVIVKVFEMRSDLAFNQSDFHPLFETPVQVLGADLLAADELVLVPGEARRISYAPIPGTRYLGVVAGFRQMERASWKLVAGIDFEAENTIGIELRDVSLLLVPPDDAPDWDPVQAVTDFHNPVAKGATETAIADSAPGTEGSADAQGRAAPQFGLTDSESGR